MDKLEISKESKEVLQNCYVITTEHTLDEDNIKLKKAIEEVLNKTMTSIEKSEYWYKYFIDHKQYNDDLEVNRNLLKEWSKILKGSGNRNYNYAYAIDRVNAEIDILNKTIDKMAEQMREYGMWVNSSKEYIIKNYREEVENDNSSSN